MSKISKSKNNNHKNVFNDTVISRRQVDSIVLKRKIINQNNQIEIIENKNTFIDDKKSENVDDSKRMFLKMAGIAGLGIAASTILPRGAEAYVAGSTPTSNVVGLKDSTNNRINPAKEDGNLADIKTNTDKFTFDGSNNLLTKSAVTVSNTSNNQINPATEESLANVGQSVNDQSLWMLRKILTLLKPIGMTTGGGSNRLSVDINSGSVTVSTISTVTTVSTVSSMTNMVNIGNVNAFSLIKDTARNAYANSIRNKISF